MTVDGIKRLFFALLIAFTLNAIAASAAIAAEYYMSPQGNDSNPGTLAAPWKTLDRLHQAQSILRPGDTVYFRGGDYVINDSSARKYYSWSAEGTASKPITYKRYADEIPVIVGDRRAPSRYDDEGKPVGGGMILLQDYITIDGLHFRETDGQRLAGGHGDNPNLRSNVNGPSWEALQSWARGITIKNSSFEGFTVALFFKGQGLLFEHNRVWNTRSHRLYMAGKNGIYRYNILGGTRGYWNQYGFQVQYESSQGNRVYGNIIYEGQGAGLVISGRASYNEIYNNIFINPGNKSPVIVPPSGTGGVVVSVWCEREADRSPGPMGPGNKVYNNTFMGRTKSAIFSDPMLDSCLGVRPISRIEIYNNIFHVTPGLRSGLTQPYSNIRNNILYNVGGIVPPGNINADPKLANPNGTQPLDAMLTAGSTAAIDKATSGAPGFDYQNGARPFGPASDIGAFEFGSPPGSGGPVDVPPGPDGGGNGSPPAICSIRPGNKFRGHINSWWNSGLKPAMMNMVAELYTTKVDQSRNLGTFIDTQNQQQAARQIQVREAEAVKRYQPSEVVCEAASVMPALTSTSMISRAVSQGYRMDFAGDATNRKGGSTANGVAQDVNTRWKEYTTRFCDPAANKGNAGCATAGPLPDADVAVENLLFKESIDLGDPDVQAATKALLRNLTQPKADNPVPPAALNSPSGQEAILRRKHLQTLRTLSAGVVGDIIGRRAQVPLATLGTGSSPAADTQIAAIRAAAGVPAAQISRNPSYNEIMLAMTKERFLNPHYFVRLGAGEGAIEQEQASLDAYTSLMLQDIYELQEQINALMAARASMKFREGFTDRKTGLMPLK